MKPGTITHTIAALLSSISSLFAHSTPEKAESPKTKASKKSNKLPDDLFAQVLAWGGVITGEHGIGLAKKRWWPDATSEVVRELHRKLKQSLDPHNILNPGKFVD